MNRIAKIAVISLIIIFIFGLCLFFILKKQNKKEYKPTEVPTNKTGLIMVGQYIGNNNNFIPFLLYINTDTLLTRQIDLSQLGYIDFTGIHEARAFKLDGKFMLALATYKNGEIIIASSDDNNFSNLKVEFKEKFGENERVRALFVNDIDGDQINDVVVGTRPGGLLKYYKKANGKWSGKVIDNLRSAAIHDLLIADLDGRDGNEIYITPSNVLHSNKPDATEMLPQIIRYKFGKSSWDKTTVWEETSPTREEGFYSHPRYMSVGNYDSDNNVEMVSGVKGFSSGLISLLTLKWNGSGYSASVQNVNEKEKLSGEVIAFGDIDNDGHNEIVLPSLTSESIHYFKLENNKWIKHTLIKNPIDDGEPHEQIISVAILNGTKNGYKKVLLVTTDRESTSDGSVKLYVLEYNSLKQYWDKKEETSTILPNVTVWGTFPGYY